jgi:DNA-directed RNA polymerase specialized sigma24 family protein
MGTALAVRSRASRRERTVTLEPAEGRRLVRSALLRRTPLERRMLTMLFYDRLSPSEVAAAMGLLPGRVSQVLRRLVDELNLATRATGRSNVARRGARRARKP